MSTKKDILERIRHNKDEWKNFINQSSPQIPPTKTNKVPQKKKPYKKYIKYIALGLGAGAGTFITLTLTGTDPMSAGKAAGIIMGIFLYTFTRQKKNDKTKRNKK